MSRLESPPAGSGLTLKAFLAGTLAILVACAMDSYNFVYIGAGELTGDWFPISGILVFLLLLFAVNPLLRLIYPRWELTRVELLLTFCMAMIAAGLTTTGFAASFLMHMTGLMYYAAPGNNMWGSLGHLIPAWLLPADRNAIVWLEEGLPVGESIPWGAWVAPLALWSVLLAALYGMLTALASIMRKQWEENERLIYPLMEAPSLLVEDYEKGVRLPPVMRKPLFWIGFLIPVAIFSTHILNGVNANFPVIRLLGLGVFTIKLGETWSEMQVHILPAIIAYGFLIKRDVLFSIWFFALMIYFQQNMMKILGYTAGPVMGFESPNPALAWQCLGGFVMFVFSGLYMARRHLREVLRKAVFNDPSIDDSEEIMPHRRSVVVFALSLATMWIFLTKMGMTLAIGGTLIAILLILYIGVTRFVIEGGLVLCRPSAPAIVAVIALFGAQSMPIASLAALVACTVFVNDLKAGYMPAFANSIKLLGAERLSRSAILKAGLYALAFGSVASLALMFWFCYDIGASQAKPWLLHTGGRTYASSLVASLHSVPTPDGSRIFWGGAGMAAMLILTLCRYNFAWWPIHPIGFPIAPTWGVQMSMGSIFVAWLAKTILLRLGGVSLYLKAKPFFIGMLIGHLLMIFAAFLANAFFGSQVNLYV